MQKQNRPKTESFYEKRLKKQKKDAPTRRAHYVFLIATKLATLNW